MTLQKAIKELEKKLLEVENEGISIEVRKGGLCRQAKSDCCIPVQGLLKALLIRELLKRILLKKPEVEEQCIDDMDGTDGMYSLCISGVSGEAIEGFKTALLVFEDYVSELSNSELDKLLDNLAARLQEDAAALEDNCK